ncbi:hypothetical protein [Rickettsia endosymbiont of Orchestes rusci]
MSTATASFLRSNARVDHNYRIMVIISTVSSSYLTGVVAWL